MTLVGASALAVATFWLAAYPAHAAPGPRFSENYLLPPISESRARDVPALAVNPANPNHIVEAEIDPINLECDYNVSFDGGRTWTGGRLRNPDGQDPSFPTPACEQNFDSGGYAHLNSGGIVFGFGQNVYITYSVHRGAFNRPESNQDGGFGDDAVVARSTDGGRTFAPAVLAVPGGGPVAANRGLAGYGMRPQLAIQRGAGTGGQDRLYVASWNCYIKVRASQQNRGGCSGGGGDRRIFVTRSDDSGATWRPPVLASAANVRTGAAIAEAGSPDEQAIEPSQPVVGPDGAVYVAYRNRDITSGTTCPANPFITTPAPGGFPANNAHCIVVARSLDGGQTWAQSSTNLPTPTGGLKNPRLAIDPATPAGVGTLYVVFQRPVGSDPADITLQSSSDRGVTWSPPVRVNDDPPGTSSAVQFNQTNPYVSVGPAGRVDVIWGDKRHTYPGGGNYGDTYFASSSNGGASFAPNRRVTDRTVSFDVGRAPDTGSTLSAGGSWYGPVSLPLPNGAVLAAWLDSRLGNVDNAFQDIFLSRLEPNVEIASSTIATATPRGLSVRLSQLAYPGGTDALPGGDDDPATRVVVVNEGDVAGALAGSVLARANFGPVLVSPADGLPGIVKAEAARLKPVGAYVIGDPSLLSSGVSSDLRDTTRNGENVMRIVGASSVAANNRPAEIARQIAELLDPLPGTSPEAVIVNPATPEAASAAALAAALRLPILFVDGRTTAPPPTTAAISSLGIKKVLIVGNTVSVAPGVQTQMNTLLGAANVTRLGGADEYATSEQVVTEARNRGLPPNVVYAADGTRPLDAAMLGAAVGRLTGLMMLAPSASSANVRSRLGTLGLDPAVDRVVSAISTGGEDPTLPLAAPVQPPAGLPTPPPAVVVAPPPPAVVVNPARRLGKLSARVTPSRRLRAPYAFRTDGTLTLPRGIRRSEGCTGRVSVQVKRGNTTISNRRTTLSRNCTFSSRVSFASRMRFASFNRLKFTARFLGNKLVLPVRAPARFVRVRPWVRPVR